MLYFFFLFPSCSLLLLLISFRSSSPPPSSPTRPIIDVIYTLFHLDPLILLTWQRFMFLFTRFTHFHLTRLAINKICRDIIIGLDWIGLDFSFLFSIMHLKEKAQRLLKEEAQRETRIWVVQWTEHKTVISDRPIL